jgi:hypothetical protein
MQLTGLSRDAVYEALRKKRILGIKLNKNWQVLRQPLDRELRGEAPLPELLGHNGGPPLDEGEPPGGRKRKQATNEAGRERPP